MFKMSPLVPDMSKLIPKVFRATPQGGNGGAAKSETNPQGVGGGAPKSEAIPKVFEAIPQGVSLISAVNGIYIWWILLFSIVDF